MVQYMQKERVEKSGLVNEVYAKTIGQRLLSRMHAFMKSSKLFMMDSASTHASRQETLVFEAQGCVDKAKSRTLTFGKNRHLEGKWVKLNVSNEDSRIVRERGERVGPSR